MRSVCVIVPAYNEAESIQKVLRQIKQVSRSYQIVVVNDGSTDQTSQLAKKSGAVVLDLPFNTGIGAAVQTGLKYAQAHGYQVAVQVDADGQHPPREIPKLLNTAKSVDFVIGSRFIKKNNYRATLSRALGIRFLSWLIQLTCGQKITDPTSGFRVYNQRVINFLSHYYPIDFPEPESVVSLLQQGFRIKEIGVTMRPRVTGKSSIINLKAVYLYTAILIGIFSATLTPRKKKWIYY